MRRRWPLMRSKPLIYFCAFGDEAQFAMLSVALESLATFSRVRCDIVVLTNAASQEILSRYLAAFRKTLRITVKHVEAADVQQYTHARYRIVRFDELRHHGPVLYLDTDIVCDGDLRPLLRKLRTVQGICALPEGHLLSPHGFWGRTLFLQDPGLGVRPSDPGISTGVLGGASIAALRRPFGLILDHIEAWFAAGNAPLFYDQANANYVMVKHGLFDGTVMGEHLRVVGHEADADPSRRLGLAHFAGGVGNNMPKLLRMRIYRAALAPDAPPPKRGWFGRTVGRALDRVVGT